MISGKGMYLWLMTRAEGGNIQQIINACVEGGLKYLMVKVSDGPVEYKGNTNFDLFELQTGLASYQIELVGWAYVYGSAPDSEAAIIIQMINKYHFKYFVINAEVEFKERYTQATALMQRLKEACPDVKFAISSYRYPNFHQTFPWKEFLTYCDYAMPQIYWVEAHNPAYQVELTLQRYKELYGRIGLARPIIPTGSAYSNGAWAATAADIKNFLDKCKELANKGELVNSVNFWEWWEARVDNPLLWPVIANYEWTEGEPPVTTLPIPVGQVKFLASSIPVRISPYYGARIMGYVYKDSEPYVFETVSKANGQEEWVRIGGNEWAAIKYYQYTNGVWIE